jgi:hypothetical protein
LLALAAEVFEDGATGGIAQGFEDCVAGGGHGGFIT